MFRKFGRKTPKPNQLPAAISNDQHWVPSEGGGGLVLAVMLFQRYSAALVPYANPGSKPVPKVRESLTGVFPAKTPKLPVSAPLVPKYNWVYPLSESRM